MKKILSTIIALFLGLRASIQTLATIPEIVDASLPGNRISGASIGDTSDWIVIAEKEIEGKLYFLIVRVNPLDKNPLSIASPELEPGAEDHAAQFELAVLDAGKRPPLGRPGSEFDSLPVLSPELDAESPSISSTDESLALPGMRPRFGDERSPRIRSLPERMHRRQPIRIAQDEPEPGAEDPAAQFELTVLDVGKRPPLGRPGLPPSSRSRRGGSRLKFDAGRPALPGPKGDSPLVPPEPGAEDPAAQFELAVLDAGERPPLSRPGSKFGSLPVLSPELEPGAEGSAAPYVLQVFDAREITLQGGPGSLPARRNKPSSIKLERVRPGSPPARFTRPTSGCGFPLDQSRPGSPPVLSSAYFGGQFNPKLLLEGPPIVQVAEPDFRNRNFKVPFGDSNVYVGSGAQRIVITWYEGFPQDSPLRRCAVHCDANHKLGNCSEVERSGSLSAVDLTDVPKDCQYSLRMTIIEQNDPNGFSKPVPDGVPDGYEPCFVFLLSRQEYKAFCSLQSPLYCQELTPEQQARQAIATRNRGLIKLCRFWLRTAGFSCANVCVVDNRGRPGTWPKEESANLLPAMWISAEKLEAVRIESEGIESAE
ncbi:MAG: hypothetical protein LBJ95_03875 [Oscillospiraceae bacterium]|nr:hypothetical protein [Oscillospiraceae bacterium]